MLRHDNRTAVFANNEVRVGLTKLDEAETFQGENRVLRKMQTDALGPLFRLEVTADGIGNHRIQFCERISLRSDATAETRVELIEELKVSMMG